MTKAQETPLRMENYQYLPLVFSPEEKIEMVGPSGGNIENIEIDPINPDIMYVGNWGSGVYKTIDGGENWFISSNGITNPFIFSLAIDPINHNTVYAGTYGDGIFKSIDGGSNWIQVSNGLYMPSVVYVITVDKNNPYVIFAGTRNKDSGTNGFNNDYNSYGGGIFKSEDGGENWEHAGIQNNDDYVYDIEIDPTDSEVVYAAMHWSGVFKSEDAGETWEQKNTGLTHEDAKKTRGIEINPIDSQKLYLATWGIASFYYSGDGGTTWETRRNGIENVDTHIYDITMDPKNPSTVYASTMNYGLYKTVNSGASWTKIAYLSYFHITVAINPLNSQIIFAGVKINGLLKSSDGGLTWNPSHNGIQANNIVSALNDPNHPEKLYISAYGNGLWKSVDKGKNWISINNGLPNLYVNTIVFRPDNPNTIYAGVLNNGIYISVDGGGSWYPRNNFVDLAVSRVSKFEPTSNPLFAHPTSMIWYQEAKEDLLLEAEEQSQINSERITYPTVNTISINSSDPNMMLIGTTGKGIWRSFDGGVHWYKTGFILQTLFSSVIDENEPIRAYMGMGYPYSFTRTTDPWLFDWNYEPIDTGIMYQKVNSVMINDSNSNIIYAGASVDPYKIETMPRGVFRSLDFGIHWSNIGLTDKDVSSLLKYPEDPTWILSGTTDGLFITKNEGISWNEYNEKIWNQTVTYLSPGYGDNLFLIGTDGGNLIIIKR